MEHARASLRATAWALKIDRTASEIVSALESADLPCVLLKGPALHRWLYADGAARPYSDVDVLVREDDSDEVASVLRGKGFSEISLSGIKLMRPTHAREFVRSEDGAGVDVHTTLFGTTAGADAVWSAVSSGSELLRVGGRPLRVPSPPVLALIVALHAAHHGAGEQRPLEDLRRAVSRADHATWEAAARLAGALGATEAFVAGLRLTPAGPQLLERLGLGAVEPGALVRLKASTPPDMAEGFAWLAAQRRLRDKVVLIAARLFPPPRFMRRWSSLARRGRAGLLLSYPWRLLWIAWRAPAGLAAWRRAKRAGG